MSQKPELDESPEARERRRAAVDRRMKGVEMNGSAYHEARRKAEAEVEAEELVAAGIAAAQADADAERERIAAVVKVGTDLNRPRQALRLALLGPVGADQARSILSTMPMDAEADAAALALSGAGSFGSKAAQGERQRITTVFGHTSAKERFRSATSLVLEGGEAMDAASAIAMLAGLPTEKPPVDGLAQLMAGAEGFEEFGDGGDFGGPAPKSVRTKAAWSKAIAEANAGLGAGAVRNGGAAIEGAKGQAIAASDDPAFGLTEAARVALAGRDRA